MNVVLSQWLMDLSLPADLLLRLSGVLLGAWLTHLALVRCNSRWRVQLWRLTSLALIVVTVCTVLPGITIHVAREVEYTAAEPDLFEPVTLTMHPQLVGVMPPDTPESNSAGFFGSHRADLPTDAAVDFIEQPLVDTSTDWALVLATRWPFGLAGLWALGVCVLGLRWCRAQLRVRRLISASHDAPIICRRILAGVRRKFSNLSGVRLRVTDDADVPFVAGIHQPTILLPQPMTEPDFTEELPAVLAHELTHVQSRDLVWMSLLHWVSIFLWFHPLVWMIRSVHNMACEEVADAIAAGQVGNTQSYSGTLARIALSTVAHPPTTVALSMARSPQIMSRLARLKLGLSAMPLTRRSVALSVLVGVVAVVPLAGIRIAEARQSAQRQSALNSDGPGRTLTFPDDRSVGRLSIALDYVSEPIDRYHHRFDYFRNWDWKDFGSAQGQVTVPQGARVKLSLQAAGAKDTSWMRRLAPDDLDELSIYPSPSNANSYPFGDDEVQAVGHLTGLSSLEIRWVQVTTRGMRSLESLTSLERLVLNSPELGNAGLTSVGKMTRLKMLSLGTMKWDDRGLRHLSNLKSLEEVNLPIPGNPGRGFNTILALPNLRYLSAPLTFNGEKLRLLNGSQKLTALSLSGCGEIQNTDLAHLARFPNLEYLELGGTSVTDAGLRYLRRLKSLRRIHLGVKRRPDGPVITDRGVAFLAELPELEHVDLSNIGGVDNALQHLSRLKKLRNLIIAGRWDTGRISDAGIAHLVGLPRLERLIMVETDLTDEAAESLAQIKTLKFLKLGLGEYGDMTDDGVARLSELHNLQYLDVSATGGWLTREGVTGLNGLPNLKDLWYYWRRPSQNVPPLDFSGLPNLETLAMTLRGQDLAGVANCRHLKSLDIGGDPALTNDDLAPVAGMTNLERLYLSGDNITDDGLVYLKNLRKLNVLSVTGNVTDAGLRHIEGMDSLVWVTVHSTNQLSPAAIRRLKNSLPNATSFRIADHRAEESQPRAVLKVGQAAPDFHAKTVDGKDLRLEDYRGKVLLLYFWSTSCAPCIASVPKLKESWEILNEYDDFAMISLSGDDSESVLQKFLKRHQFQWPQARIGEKSKIASDYGVRGYPKYILIGRDGKILSHTKDRLDTALRSALDVEEDS